MKRNNDISKEGSASKLSHISPVTAAAVILAVSTLVTLAALVWLLNASRYGIDLTDESFYLVWISDPFKYKVSAFLFGFVYHPLHQLVGGDIALLRQSNIVLTFCLAWGLGFCFFRTAYKEISAFTGYHNLYIACLAAILASGSLVFLSVFWLPTPSYNSLSLQALLIAGTGLLLTQKSATRASILGWILLGVAGWLAFMAKPTTAVALALACSLYFVVARKLNPYLIALSALVAATLLFLSAIAIDGSLHAFSQRLIGGVAAAKMLGAGHTLKEMLRIDSFSLNPRYELLVSFLAFLIFLSTYFSTSRTKSLLVMAFVISLLFSVTGLALIFRTLSFDTAPYQFQGLLVFAVPVATLTLAITRFGATTTMGRNDWALVLVFGLFPFIFAFGTGSNYWVSASSAAIFWALASLLFLAPASYPARIQWGIFVPTVAGLQLITIMLLNIGMHNPYRQIQPLHQNDHPASVGSARSQLVLSQNFAEYLQQVDQAATGHGFQRGSPMIDLTGHYPGTLYSLGARILGEVWAAGGYRGSNNFAVAALDRESCAEISAAWILVEPTGPRALSSKILDRYGADLQRDYEVAGLFHSPTGSYPKSYAQYLLKPSRSPEVAKLACEQSKGSRP